MKEVLFLCTHNSARSQMAEGILNHYSKGRYKAFSAGTQKTKVNPLAIQVMKELGINIENQFSKNLDYFKDQNFDMVVSVCDSAKETCPTYFKKSKKRHWFLKNPSQIKGTYEEQLIFFRSVRDELVNKIKKVFHA